MNMMISPLESQNLEALGSWPVTCASVDSELAECLPDDDATTSVLPLWIGRNVGGASIPVGRDRPPGLLVRA